MWFRLGLIVVAFLGMSCERTEEAPAFDSPERAAVQTAQFDANLEAPAPGNAAAPAAGLAVLASSQPDRYLIKNAVLTVETVDARAAADQVVAAMQQVQGFVSNLHETVTGLGNRTITMQVRIPSNAFDQSMTQIETLGKVLNKQVNAQDVTEEYVDVEARALNLKSTERRLLEHLERAGALEDILRVEQELTRVRGQIEQLEGRLRFLSDRVSFSTISLTLQEAPKAEPMTPAESFSTAKTTSEAVRSLVAFGRGIWVLIIWVGVWSPVWLPILAMLIVLIRTARNSMPLTHDDSR